jgi:signal transduction histidine kinase
LRAVRESIIAETPFNPKVLEPTVQEEAYTITSEALTNAFRHGSASKIEVEIAYESSALRIRVRDDGVGIDKSVVSSGQPGHWGLTGMRERARAIRAELKIWRREAAGQGLFRLEQQAEW